MYVCEQYYKVPPEYFIGEIAVAVRTRSARAMFSVATRSSFAGWKKLLPFKSLSSRRTRAGSSRTQCLRFSSSPKEHSLRSELSRLAAPHSFLAEGNESDVKLPSQRDTEQLIKIRHSAAHVLAMAVQKLFPSAKVAIGPWIENGWVKRNFNCCTPHDSVHQCNQVLL